MKLKLIKYPQLLLQHHLIVKTSLNQTFCNVNIGSVLQLKPNTSTIYLFTNSILLGVCYIWQNTGTIYNLKYKDVGTFQLIPEETPSSKNNKLTTKNNNKRQKPKSTNLIDFQQLIPSDCLHDPNLSGLDKYGSFGIHRESIEQFGVDLPIWVLYSGYLKLKVEDLVWKKAIQYVTDWCSPSSFETIAQVIYHFLMPCQYLRDGYFDPEYNKPLATDKSSQGITSFVFSHLFGGRGGEDNPESSDLPSQTIKLRLTDYFSTPFIAPNVPGIQPAGDCEDFALTTVLLFNSLHKSGLLHSLTQHYTFVTVDCLINVDDKLSLHQLAVGIPHLLTRHWLSSDTTNNNTKSVTQKELERFPTLVIESTDVSLAVWSGGTNQDVKRSSTSHLLFKDAEYAICSGIEDNELIIWPFNKQSYQQQSYYHRLFSLWSPDLLKQTGIPEYYLATRTSSSSASENPQYTYGCTMEDITDPERRFHFVKLFPKCQSVNIEQLKQAETYTTDYMPPLLSISLQQDFSTISQPEEEEEEEEESDQEEQVEREEKKRETNSNKKKKKKKKIKQSNGKYKQVSDKEDDDEPENDQLSLAQKSFFGVQNVQVVSGTGARHSRTRLSNHLASAASQETKQQLFPIYGRITKIQQTSQQFLANIRATWKLFFQRHASFILDSHVTKINISSALPPLWRVFLIQRET